MGIGGCGGGESNNVRNTSLHTYMCVYTYAAVSAQKSSIDGLVTPMDSKVYMYSQCIHANTQTRTYILCTPKTHHELPYRNTLQHPATHCNTLQPDTAHCTSLQHNRFIPKRCRDLPYAQLPTQSPLPPHPVSRDKLSGYWQVLLQCVAVCCSDLQ